MAAIDDITNLYVGYFNRAPDPAGLNFWVAQRAAGASLDGIANSFSLTSEAQALYGFLAAPLVGNPASFLAGVYSNLFGRTDLTGAADVAGIAYWTAQLANPAISVGRIIVDIISGAQGNDALVVANKSAVGKFFVQSLVDQNLDFNAAAAAAASTAFNGVTSDAATVTTANAAVTTALSATGSVGGSVTGSTFALTTGVDNANGTFIDGSRALTVAGAFDTLTSSDKISGTAGTTDTLFAQFVNGSFASPVSITGIETVSVENVGANAATLDLSNGDGAINKVKFANSTTNSMTVQNVQSAVANVEVANTNQTLTLGIAATKLAGTTDAVAISLSTVNSGTLVVGNTGTSGYETFNITSTGALINGVGGTLTVGDGTSTSLSTVNVTGTAGLNMTLSDASVTKVDASALTGRINLVVAAGSGAQTITGTAAGDTLNLNGTYTAADVINGGDGTDTVLLTSAELVAGTTPQAGVTNLEVIALTSALNGVATPGNFGVNILALNAGIGGASTVNFAAGTAGNLQLGSVAGAALTVNVAGTATNDAIALTIGSTTTVNNFGANNVIINGAETVNLTSQGVGAGGNIFGGTFVLTATAAAENIVITGTAPITFTGAVTADSIDAGALTGGGLVLTGGTTAASIITGSAAGDTLIASGGADIINAGAGNDLVTGLVGADIINVGTGTDNIFYTAAGQTFSGAVTSGVTNLSATIDVVSGMGAGDKINLFAGVGVTAATVTVNTLLTAGTADNVALVRGNFAAGVFTASATGADTLFQYDDDGVTAGGNIESVVLVGFVGTTGVAAANLFTLA